MPKTETLKAGQTVLAQTGTEKQPETTKFVVEISPSWTISTVDIKKWLLGALMTGGAVALTYMADHATDLKLTADQATVLVAVINIIMLALKKIATNNVELVQK